MSSTFHSPLHVLSFLRHVPRPLSPPTAFRTPPPMRLCFAPRASAACRARSHDTSSIVKVLVNGGGDVGAGAAAGARARGRAGTDGTTRA